MISSSTSSRSNSSSSSSSNSSSSSSSSSSRVVVLTLVSLRFVLQAYLTLWYPELRYASAGVFNSHTFCYYNNLPDYGAFW